MLDRLASTLSYNKTAIYFARTHFFSYIFTKLSQAGSSTPESLSTLFPPAKGPGSLSASTLLTVLPTSNIVPPKYPLFSTSSSITLATSSGVTQPGLSPTIFIFSGSSVHNGVKILAGLTALTLIFGNPDDAGGFSSCAKERTKPFSACLLATYIGFGKNGVWPATEDMCGIQPGFLREKKCAIAS